jgi:hypothetical protein
VWSFILNFAAASETDIEIKTNSNPMTSATEKRLIINHSCRFLALSG